MTDHRDGDSSRPSGQPASAGGVRIRRDVEVGTSPRALRIRKDGELAGFESAAEGLAGLIAGGVPAGTLAPSMAPPSRMPINGRVTRIDTTAVKRRFDPREASV